MTVPHYRVGEECYIGTSTAYPELSGAECKVIGTLKLRQCCNADGYFERVTPSYKVEISGTQFCAPQSMLRKKFERSDWGMLRSIWRPDRSRNITRPTAWKEFK